MTQFNYGSFREFASIVLGAILGGLIILPFALPDQQASNFWILLVGLFAGGLIGYKRRKSVAFLYFCMIAVVILASVLSARIQIGN